jgi:HAD superfamily hydrolase (TIGR01509 family)
MGRETLALEAILPMIGDGARVLVARALGPDAAKDGPLVERTAAIFQDAYAARPCVHTTLLPGAVEALAAIDHVPRALITNKPRRLTMLIIEALHIAELFGVVYAGGDGPLKPAPNGLQTSAATLGVDVRRAWMIGDGPQDILAGHAAGCITIAVPGIASRDRVIEAKPHAIVDSLLDVARLAATSV